MNAKLHEAGMVIGGTIASVIWVAGLFIVPAVVSTGAILLVVKIAEGIA